MIRDTWRAILVLVVGVLLMEFYRRPNVQVVHAPPPAWQPVQVPVQWQPPDRPLRRVASALTELGDSVIGAIR